MSFTVKETVCPRALLQLQTTSRTLEQCDFKENGVRLSTEVWGCWWVFPKMLNNFQTLGCGWEVVACGFQFDLEPPLFSW